MADFEMIPVRPIPDTAADTVRAEQQRAGTIEGYPTHLERRAFWHSSARRALRSVSKIVEPSDRVLGKDELTPPADAFYKGSLIGLRVVSLCVDDVIKHLRASA